jgi:hypothetical protein
MSGLHYVSFYTNLYTNLSLVSKYYTNYFIAPDNRSLLLVWKSLENQLPQLSAMARDLLCIAIAGVGVERAFNYARDMCNYRRGHTKPDTLRAEMLVFFSQLSESRHNELQEKLRHIINIKDMTEEEMEVEIQQQEAEINLRSNKMDSWDMDSYISDDESTQGISLRTRRQQLKREYIKRKGRRNNSSSYTQVLSSYDRDVRAILEQDQQQSRAQREQAEQQAELDNPRRWSVPLEEDEEINRNRDGEEVNLPQIRQSHNFSSKGRRITESYKRQRLN